MIIDFHACPSVDLSLVKDRLSSIKVTRAVLQPIDALPLFHILPNDFLRKLSVEDQYSALLWSKFITKLTSMWSSRMYDNVKLWYETMNNYDDFFVPLASINPSLGTKYVYEKLNELEGLNVKGIVVSPTLQLFDPTKTKAFRAILEYVERNDILLIMHLDPCPYSVDICFESLMPDILNDLLERYSIKLVLSALGISEGMSYPWLERIVKLMKRYDRVYIESTGISCILFNTLMGKNFVRSVGTDRIIYGGGYPYLRLKQVIMNLRCVESSGLPRHDLESILFDNAIYLLRDIDVNLKDEEVENKI
ncbi:MAG: amidohydrolase family protein [Vulcanisaeta sp.]|jgi:predicted TIM-barrel fold metal-dependent hydrolase|uniref:amidohydrolase family protein n=1 Tax=Vulcanisaeta sp. TaxID=2020871 RepID=UPI003D12EB2C